MDIERGNFERVGHTYLLESELVGEVVEADSPC